MGTLFGSKSKSVLYFFVLAAAVLSFQSCGKQSFNSKESDNAALFLNNSSTDGELCSAGEACGATTTVLNNTITNSSGNTNTRTISSSQPTQLVESKTPQKIPQAQPAETLQNKTFSLPFINLKDVRNYFPVPEAKTAIVYSNQVVISGLPPEGGIITILELQDPDGGKAGGAQVEFGFNINNEDKYYISGKKDRRVFNGDLLKFKYFVTKYFDMKKSIQYAIGDAILGRWSVTTMKDPGTTPLFSAFSFSNGTYTKANQLTYSNVVTVSGLGQGESVRVSWSNILEGFELAINDVWYQNPYTQMSSLGTYIKNNDKLQFRFTPKSGKNSYNTNLIVLPVGALPSDTTKKAKFLKWIIYIE